MRKYKFKIGQEVYLWGDSYAQETYANVVQRITEEGKHYYKLKTFVGIILIVNENGIHDVPRQQGDICSKNGCEIVNSFLEKSEMDVLQEEFAKIQIQLELKKYGLTFLKELMEKIEIEIRMLEYDSSTVWNKLYNSSDYYNKNILEFIT